MPSLQFAISIPSPASALAFVSQNHLCVGADDGSLRLYHLSSPRVVRAIKSLEREISAIACTKPTTGEPGDIWLASGLNAFLFALGTASSQKLILSMEDAHVTLTLGEDAEDVLNELSISVNGRHLAFCSDGGAVGTVEVSTRRVSRMKTRHSSICGAIKFVPDRPSELVSGGYDSAVLHFDFVQGVLLSRFDIAVPPPSTGVSLSPPFVLTTAIAPTGLFAAGTADGRVWLGGGGEKLASAAKKKRSRKWEGLKEDEGLWLQAADGPVVAVTFTLEHLLVWSSLLGRVSARSVSRNADGQLVAEQKWAYETKSVTKVNAMVTQEDWLVLGGLGQDGKGVVEVLKINQEQSVINSMEM